MIMSEWKEYRLGDVGKIVTGKTPKTAITDNYGGNIPFLSPSDNMELKYVPITARHLTEKGLAEVKSCLIPENSVCVSCIGSDMGKSVITVRPIVTNQQINSIIPSSNFDTNFLYYILQNKKREIKFLGRNGTAVPILNKSAFSNLTIFAPELDEQRSIASILSSLDSKIENNRKICANLEAQAQALFKHWFIDFAPFKDGKFVESELGIIPEGWSVGKVQDLASKMASGGTPTSTNIDYYGGDVLWFSTKELTDNFLLDSEKHITQTGLENSSAKLFPEDTVLMAIYAATVGRLGILTQEASFNQAAVGIVAKEEIGYEYIYLLLLSERKNLINLACGAAQQNLNVGIVKNYKCVIPTKQVLSTFRKMVTEIFLQCKELQKESSRLGELRDTLLPKLMSGEIKV